MTVTIANYMRITLCIFFCNNNKNQSIHMCHNQTPYKLPQSDEATFQMYKTYLNHTYKPLFNQHRTDNKHA